MEVVEGGNVLHHVKREGIVREGEMSGGNMSWGNVRSDGVSSLPWAADGRGDRRSILHVAGVFLDVVACPRARLCSLRECASPKTEIPASCYVRRGERKTSASY